MAQEIKKTRLHGWHVGAGANMARFGDYEMPMWYPAGAKNEHLSVINAAGLFDTSHMAVVMVAGGGALTLLQKCFSKNLDACIGKDHQPLFAGRSVYGVFLDESGHVIDDAIVFQIDAADYMVVVNAGMGGVISDALKAHAPGDGAVVTDLSDRVGKFDLQGPASAKILTKVIKNAARVFDTLPYFAFKGHFDRTSPHSKAVELIDGTPILLSRTGYTGEFGFELFTDPAAFVTAWHLVFDAGRDLGLLPCGLAARDSLRAGAVLPLSHQDIGPWPFLNNPWPFALPYDESQNTFTKDFVGAAALLNSDYREATLPFAGFDLRKVNAQDPAEVLDAGGRPIGTVLTCATDMAIGRHESRIYSIASPDQPGNFNPRGLCCGFVKVDRRPAAGDRVVLKDRRRQIEVEIVDDIRPARTARKPLAEFLPQ